MDRKSIVAIALCILVLIFYPQILKVFGLDKYLAPARPALTAPADTTHRTAATTASDTAVARGAAPTGEVAIGSAHPAAPERTWTIETPLYRAVFSDRGARL